MSLKFAQSQVRRPKLFIFLLRNEFSIPISNSAFRILNSEPEFRNPHFEKKMCMEILFFGDATSRSVHGVGPFDLKLEQYKQ